MSNRSALSRRLRPLHVAIALQGFALWIPVEKLFMSEIGFDAASVGLLAAAYAAVVPIVEVPSGVLADRWSRRGVLVLASLAALLCSLLGGLSTDVAAYILANLLLGVYLAMYSGAMEAVVYDTVLEETGGSDEFEQRLGRVRFVESVLLVGSALAGGWLAELTSPRLMYFLTVPFMAASAIAYLRFREPQLHRADAPGKLREHLAVTFRALTGQRRLLPIVGLAVLTAVTMQVVFEFGPLWLVAMAVPAALFGPHWAGLMATLGLGGLLAGRLRLDRPATLAVVVAAPVLSGLALTYDGGVVVVTVAQVAIALLMVMASIVASRLLHDSVPSAVRSGVASGVGALSWIAFVPVGLLAGQLADRGGVHAAGWLIVVTSAMAGALLAGLMWRARPAAAAATAAAATTAAVEGDAIMSPCPRLREV